MQDADRQCSALEKPQSSELRNRKRAAQKTSIRAERIRLFNKFIFMEENIMVVQHNLSAMNAQRYYGINNSGLSKSLEKLSSGYAINRAGDNAAGLAVSEKMRAQISGLTQASKNAQDGISMVQTFEGALTETDSILQRMRSLAVQSANGTYQNDVDREAIQLEYDQLNDELNQIADTDFNGVIVLNGGQMADGTKADGNGNIDYSTATRESQQVGTAGGFVKGLSTNGLAADAKDETAVFTATVDADGNVTWSVNDGAKNGAVTQSTNKQGGFTYAGVDVHVDTSKIVNGDTISLKFTAATAEVKKTGKVVGTSTDVKGTSTMDAAGELKISIDDDNVTDENIAAAINGLNGLTIKETTGADGTTISSTTFNDKSAPATAAAKTELFKVGDKASVFLKNDGKIYYNDGVGGNDTELATWTATTAAAGAQASATTFTTKVGVSQAMYTPASGKGVELVEPDNKVSQSNSNDASTATLTYKDNITLQVGARTKDSVNFTFAYESNGLGDLKADLDCSARGLGTDDLSLASQKDANAAIDKIDNAINKVSMVRGTFGSIQNRLEHKINNLDTNNENLTAAESRIRDTEMDKEMMKFTSNQILSQAAQSMLAQANSLPQGVLQLLG